MVHFLKYVENSVLQYAEGDNAFLKRLHERIVEVKSDQELEGRYMLFEEMLAERESEGLKLGLSQGLSQGLKQGEELIQTLILKMLNDGKTEEIARLSEAKFLIEMKQKYQIK